MRSATHAHTTSRRTLLAQAGTAAVVGVTASTAAGASAAEPHHPDAELLRLGDELERAWTEERAAFHATEGICTHETDEYTDAFVGKTSEIAARIKNVPARTFDGLLVKVRAIQWCRDCDLFEPEESWKCSTDSQLAKSIANDLMLMRGGVA